MINHRPVKITGAVAISIKYHLTMGVQVARSNLKTKDTSNFVRNTLCTRSTFRIVVQTVFATLTVASFILIVSMSMKSPGHINVVQPPSRCIVVNCRVICRQAPLYEKYENDLIQAITEGGDQCQRIVLELHSPMFVNNTFPETWLADFRAYITHLIIILGNLEHIPCGCFMSTYARNIHTLEFHGLKLRSWHPNSLVGLSSLRTINIKRSVMTYVEANFLKPVDNTLETLQISHSGHWNPKYVTGSKGFANLIVVDFSYNDFGDILGADSFVGLDKCKVLYLNSCKITSIAAGAFDHLTSIENLYLNKNLLKAVPSGLFITIITILNPIPRINLQDNKWHCDCEVNDLRQLVQKDLLLIDAICIYPSQMEYKTFSEFEHFCANGHFPIKDNTTDKNTANNGIITPDPASFGVKYDTSVYCLDGGYCKVKHTKNTTFRVIGVDIGNKCRSAKLNTSLLDFHSQNNFEDELSDVRLVFEFTFVYESETYTVLQIDSLKSKGYGLVWYDEKCPDEAYCVDKVPKFLRIYNMKKETTYIFCALDLKTGEIEKKNCVYYVLTENLKRNSDLYERHRTGISYFAYGVTIVLCFCFGSSLVYALIRLNPMLLKGSKRILFVKHKNVDALVLPPTLPLRNNEVFKDNEKKVNDIFTVSKFNNLTPKEFNFYRQKSVRSNKSAAPSYVSALEPTNDQLAEWRIKHHFNNSLSLSSTKSELSSLSYNVPEAPYCSLDESDSIYESIK